MFAQGIFQGFTFPLITFGRSVSIKTFSTFNELILKGIVMTRLGIILQFLSKMSNQSEEELFAWAHKNVEPGVMQKLNEEVSRDELTVLVGELEKSPEAFFSRLLRQMTRENDRKISGKCNSSPIETSVL